MLDAVDKASMRAKDLTLQLLTFSKGGSPIKKVIDDIDVLIKDTTQFVLSGSDIKSHFDFCNEIWKVNADEGQISQVISNLVINSKQAMPNGGKLKIGLENVELADSHCTATNDKYIKIKIEDSGNGIDRDNLKKIFDPYFTTKESGTGLGLATCYTIIKNHGGYIEAESEKGVGSSFYIYLPASEKENSHPEPVGNDIYKGGVE